MTEAQRQRFERDLTNMSGGEKPIAVFKYHDGWSATFKTEIAALRVANHYTNARRVKYAPNVDGWIAAV